MKAVWLGGKNSKNISHQELIKLDVNWGDYRKFKFV